MSAKPRPWVPPRLGGYQPKPTGQPKPAPPQGRGAASQPVRRVRVMWDDDESPMHPSSPPAPTLTETDRAEVGRLYGPRGEVLTVIYDRPARFGFAK